MFTIIFITEILSISKRNFEYILPILEAMALYRCFVTNKESLLCECVYFFVIYTVDRDRMSLSNYMSESHLSKAGLFSRNVAPLLDDRFLDLPGVGPGSGADLLGYIHTLLGGLQLGHQLGDVLTGSLGLQRTLLLRGILYNSLDLVIALFSSFFKATSSRSTQLPGLLGTASDGSVLLHWLLRHGAPLLGPLGALGVGGVAGGLVPTLLF